jgi:hypothetical protein
MLKNNFFLSELRNERGVTLIFVALILIVLLGIAALALDIGHLFVTKNELQNAADAGALAGARNLYNNDGTAVRLDCNDIAREAARENLSEKEAVEVTIIANTGDVQRGHWSFATRTFTENSSTTVIDFWNFKTEELDINPDFINAVQVTARRRDTPISSWFARIFGFQNFIQSATAVAYIGFAGSLAPGEGDQPIAICKESITTEEGQFVCKVGRMLNSGSDPYKEGKPLDYNTAAWTNMTQPCVQPTPPDVKPLACGAGKPDLLSFCKGIGTNNGTEPPILVAIKQCWSPKNQPLKMTLPVVQCGENHKITNCMPLVGVVEIEIVWINDTDAPKYDTAPKEMGDWPSSTDLTDTVSSLEQYFVPNKNGDVFPTSFYQPTDKLADVMGDTYYGASNDKDHKNKDYQEYNGKVRWASFVKHFDLRNVGELGKAPYAYFDKLAIYFRSTCKLLPPTGNSQGENYGILARIPVLVK